MWNDWEGANESLQESDQNEHGQLVLSWKRLNVSVKKITHTFFESSRITYKQILYNGEYLPISHRIFIYFFKLVYIR